MQSLASDSYVRWYEEVDNSKVAEVGGKNASLGEMIGQLQSQGVRVPIGFATTAQLFRDFMQQNALQKPVADLLLQIHSDNSNLAAVGSQIRGLVAAGNFLPEQQQAIEQAYIELGQRLGSPEPSVAVRSSATAEDLPEASFAGQQESYLNVTGADDLLNFCRLCLASLYTDRAIVYRQAQGFAHDQVALSVGVQQMLESECAGVMFSLDTETGCPSMVLINGAWGLGETIVKGSVTPDRFMVYKPHLAHDHLRPIVERQLGSKLVKMVYDDNAEDNTRTLDTSENEQHQLVLNDDEVLLLSRWAQLIESHYACAMDMEWAKDSLTGQLYIVQARPETVQSQASHSQLFDYHLQGSSELLLKGASVGSAIATGSVCKIDSPADIEQFPEGAMLVAQRTDPDWVPVMRKASGIITDTGGPTSHAAIVSRELKVPAIVGTAQATQLLEEGRQVTLSCADGAVGKVFDGALPYVCEQIDLQKIPATETDIMLNIAMPDSALRWWAMPNAGIGLTRIEFIISSLIGAHPMALLHPEKVTDEETRNKLAELVTGYERPRDYFVDNLAMGVGKIAASVYPRPVIVRMSDFKSNEYRGLLAGEDFELQEENPMLGLRGASRYYHERYREAFKLECEALVKARETMGFDNIIVMIPFCRTPKEADQVLAVMAEAGLKRGENGLQVYVMCEIPANVILADQFAQRFDGFSIGSNDLTQLVLGIDRDSAELKPMFDARDEAVKRMIAQVIEEAHKHGCKVGICGQAPSDHPEFTEFLVACGIDSISLNPDSVPAASLHVAAAEARIKTT